MVRLGNWNNILLQPTVNRGIGGDTTALVLERMPVNGYSYARDAYLFMGINDIFRGATAATSFSYYTQVINKAKEMGFRVTVISTMLCNTTMSAPCTVDRVQRVKDLNAMLQTVPGIRFIDANAVLSDNDGLIAAYTYDGVHLNSTGYNLLRDLLYASNA